MHKRLLITLIGWCLLLAACGTETAPTVQPTVAAEPTAVSSTTVAAEPTAPAPTEAPTQAQPEPTAPAPTEAPTQTQPEPTAPAPTEAPTGSNTTGSIIFQSTDDGSVRAIDLETGNTRVLADPTEINQVLPWSAAPDGQRIAVITGYGLSNPKGGGLEEAALWVVNVDETEPRKLLEVFNPNTLNPDDMTAAWLPQVLTGQFQNIIWTADGREVIVTSAHEGQVDLYAITVESGAARQLTNTPDFEFDATLSPNGEWIAYGSTSSFGTGAGWGDVQVQAQAYLGGDIHSVVGDPSVYPPAAANILGWTSDGRVVSTTSDNGAGTMILWRAAPGQEPQNMIEDSFFTTAHMQNDQVAYALWGEQQPDAANQVFVWNALSDEEPVPIFQENGLDFIEWSPNAANLLLCQEYYGQQSQALIWQSGAIIESELLDCKTRAWSEQGNLAVGNLVLRGAEQTYLAETVLPAGWDGNTLYYFEPTADARWQLYAQAADGTTSPVGEPIDVQPHQPKFVR